LCSPPLPSLLGGHLGTSLLTANPESQMAVPFYVSSRSWQHPSPHQVLARNVNCHMTSPILQGIQGFLPYGVYSSCHGNDASQHARPMVLMMTRCIHRDYSTCKISTPWCCSESIILNLPEPPYLSLTEPLWWWHFGRTDTESDP
jgi:hypothetical protein